MSLRPMSKKRARSRPQRRKVVAAVFERDQHRCRARTSVPSVTCAGPLDPHEIIPRSAWAAGEFEVGNIIAVCRAHHDWIGDHPTSAHELGLHGYSWER